jgi:hypothetical protein
MQFVYLILSIYFGRKNPLYYLIFPIALVSGPGAFIDPRTVLLAADVFLIGKNIYKDVIIIYLLFVAFSLREHWSTNLLLKTPMLLYGLFIMALIFITFGGSGTNYEAVNVSRLFIYMILGYFLLLHILSTANIRQFISFFNFLFAATGVLSIFYVINSANILPIFYKENLYQIIDIGQVSFYRDFSTIPYFSHLLFILAFSLTVFKVKDFNRVALSIVLITYPFVLLYTFTRSLLATTLMECTIIILALVIKSPSRIFRISTIVILVACMSIFWIVQTKFKNQLSYFTQRVHSAQNEGANEENVNIRIAYHVKAYEIVNTNHCLLFGGGINKKFEPEMVRIGAWSADSTIPFFLIYTGFVGVVFYYIIFLHFLFRTIKYIRKLFNPFSIALFALILSSLFSSLLMGGFSWGDPFVFFPFVLVITTENLIVEKNLQMVVS